MSTDNVRSMNRRYKATPIRDSLANLLTGMGLFGRDKSVSTLYTYNPLTKDQLDAAYRGDWIARKVVNIPAQDSTREWRAWQADKEDLTKIEDEEQRLDVRRKVKRAMILARLYGGGAILIGTRDSDVSKELDPESIGADGLKYLHVVSSWNLGTDEIETDIESDYFGLPKSYTLTSQNQIIAEIHPSRVVRFIGGELPDHDMIGIAGSAGWGDSIIQIIDDAIKNVGMVSGGIASLVQEAKLDIVKLTSLDEMVTKQEYRDNLSMRMQVMNSMKSLWGVTILDSRDEWDRKELNFGSLPQVLQMYLLIASGACDIPATRLLGQAPMGMNATGESDIRNYYDRVRSDQTTELTPTLHMLDECLIVSAFGSRPADMWYDWRPLWASTDMEKSEIALKKAQTFQIDVTAGVINEEALREGRENQLIEDGTYPGFEQALEEAEKMKQQALSELDPEIRKQFEQMRAAQIVGLPALPEAGLGGARPPTRGAPEAPGAAPTAGAPATAPARNLRAVSGDTEKD